MTSFLFKSSKGLIKNSPIDLVALNRDVLMLLREQRLQRSDLKDIKLMINKVLIDKHLQDQVDNYFEENPDEPPNDIKDLD